MTEPNIALNRSAGHLAVYYFQAFVGRARLA